MNDNNLFAEHIYNLICGNYAPGGFQFPQSNIVENEFADGKDCANRYNSMLDAYSRLCTRLGTTEWDDPDVEIIINALLDNTKILALKMFDYGMYFGGVLAKDL